MGQAVDSLLGRQASPSQNTTADSGAPVSGSAVQYLLTRATSAPSVSVSKSEDKKKKKPPRMSKNFPGQKESAIERFVLNPLFGNLARFFIKSGQNIGEGIAVKIDPTVAKYANVPGVVGSSGQTRVRDVAADAVNAFLDASNIATGGAPTAIVKGATALKGMSRTAKLLKTMAASGQIGGLYGGVAGGAEALAGDQPLLSTDSLKKVATGTVFGYGVGAGLGAGNSAVESVLARFAAKRAARQAGGEAATIESRVLRGEPATITERRPTIESTIPKIERRVVNGVTRETATIGGKVEPLVPDRVVQVAHADGKTSIFRIPEREFPTVVEKIDGTNNGIAGIKLKNGDVLHVTAKTPESLIKKEGFIDAGVISVKDIPTRQDIAAGKVFTPSTLALELPRVQPIEDQKFSSRVFERLQQEHPELEGDLTYERINLKKDADSAVDLVKNKRQEAYEIAMGVREAPEGQTRTAINIALAEKALDDGNTRLYSRLTKTRSLEQTRRGQEIVAEKGSVTNNSTARYVKEAIAAKLDKLGKNFLADLRDPFNRTAAKTRAVKRIDAEVAKARKVLNSKKLDIKEAQKFLDSLACK